MLKPGLLMLKPETMLKPGVFFPTLNVTHTHMGSRFSPTGRSCPCGWLCPRRFWGANLNPTHDSASKSPPRYEKKTDVGHLMGAEILSYAELEHGIFRAWSEIQRGYGAQSETWNEQ